LACRIRKPREYRKCNTCGELSYRSLCEFHWSYQKLYDRFKKAGVNKPSDAAWIGADEAECMMDRHIVTNLVYVDSEEQLYWDYGNEGSRRVSPARSGPWGKGHAPAGTYLATRPVIIAADEKNKPYTDPLGFAWWCDMEPLFYTPRTGFGLHPDGNVPGTLGCVGVIGNTQTLYQFLKKAPEPILIQVVT
jgi:hypothetical protein